MIAELVADLTMQFGDLIFIVGGFLTIALIGFCAVILGGIWRRL